MTSFIVLFILCVSLLFITALQYWNIEKLSEKLKRSEMCEETLRADRDMYSEKYKKAVEALARVHDAAREYAPPF